MKKKLSITIASELNIDPEQVKNTVKLLEEGNTVPFIARYRKEKTGKLGSQEIRNIKEHKEYLEKLEQRKNEVINSINEQDKLTEELKQKIEAASILQEVEDLYRPFKQKRQTRATKAKERGLKPLAELIWKQELKQGNTEEIAQKYIDPEKELNNIEDVFQGARDIIAEWISEDAEIRKKIRKTTYEKGIIKCSLKDNNLEEKDKYKIYFDYQEKIKKIPPHRILAINRGENKEILHIKIDINETLIYSIIINKVIKNNSFFKDQLLEAMKDSYKRLIGPSISRDIRNKLTEKAEEQALDVFGRNLRSLLLQSPLRNKVVMGIDPAFRTGCKICVVDNYGKLLTTETIYPHPPKNEQQKSINILNELIKEFKIDIIAIGNGTASRETEQLISDLNKKGTDINYTIINEAGASVYSASDVGRKEFPDLDVAMRGAVSIARRLQDPLAELVKIEPRHIGVGLYQHDINTTRLETSLENVVEEVVNYVGVELNTASSSLLQYVSGINSSAAKNIVDYREENNGFTKLNQLKKVYGVGPKTFTQAAGFLKIFSKEDPLAATSIHPESYKETKKLIKKLGYSVEDLLNTDSLKKFRKSLKELDIEKMANELNLGLPTLKDIIKSLGQPGRDPRQDSSKPVFKKNVLKIEDIKENMILQGKVTNIVDFGIFVDIGVKQDGLVHISEISNQYVNHPLDVVSIGETVQVKVLDVDINRNRISLSMKI